MPHDLAPADHNKLSICLSQILLRLNLGKYLHQRRLCQLNFRDLEHFAERSGIADHQSEHECSEDSLIISCCVTHVNNILPIVCYWLPNARIRRSTGLQIELKQNPSEYIWLC